MFKKWIKDNQRGTGLTPEAGDTIPRAGLALLGSWAQLGTLQAGRRLLAAGTTVLPGPVLPRLGVWLRRRRLAEGGGASGLRVHWGGGDPVTGES